MDRRGRREARDVIETGAQTKKSSVDWEIDETRLIQR